jgi:hypothetical protein
MSTEPEEVNAALPLRPDGLRPGSVSAAMVDLVVRDQGASFDELAETTKAKNPVPLLRRACRRAGLVLRFHRSDLSDGSGSGRYFAS